MKRWLYMRAIAARHTFGWYGLKTLWELRNYDGGVWYWIKLRWLGGLRWGWIFWENRKVTK